MDFLAAFLKGAVCLFVVVGILAIGATAMLACGFLGSLVHPVGALLGLLAGVWLTDKMIQMLPE